MAQITKPLEHLTTYTCTETANDMAREIVRHEIVMDYLFLDDVICHQLRHGRKTVSRHVWNVTCRKK